MKFWACDVGQNTLFTSSTTRIKRLYSIKVRNFKSEHCGKLGRKQKQNSIQLDSYDACMPAHGVGYAMSSTA